MHMLSIQPQQRCEYVLTKTNKRQTCHRWSATTDCVAKGLNISGMYTASTNQCIGCKYAIKSMPESLFTMDLEAHSYEVHSKDVTDHIHV